MECKMKRTMNKQTIIIYVCLSVPVCVLGEIKKKNMQWCLVILENKEDGRL